MFISSSLFSISLLASMSVAGTLQHGHLHAHFQAHSRAHSEVHIHKHSLSDNGNDSHDVEIANNTVSKRGGYQLRDSYTVGNFFNEFNFFDGADPTHGFVSYQNQGAAWQRGLINTNDNLIHMGVDSTTYNPSGGRASVRVESKKSWTHGLFIADIHHMPASACGIWPAYWLFGPDWPGSGEIDIIEGVSQQRTNAITLHTAPGCSIETSGSQQGTNLLDPNCNKNNANEGCGTTTTAPYGDAFNDIGGGVYAMQWESSGIYVWFFPRGSIPGDIQAEQPDTGSWGTPLVAFNGGDGCNIDRYFKNQNIIFDTTFCGDWAGSVWGYGECGSKANSCQDYVANNPSAFREGHWKVESVKVYQ